VKAAHVHDSAPTTVGSVCQISQADNIECVPGKTIRSLVIAGFSTTTASHTQRARFTVTRQKAAALAVADTEALGRTARCQTPFDNVLYNLESVNFSK
jgi:hypothetical protein